VTDLRKAHPYGWTRKPTYEELDKIFERCRELHQEAEAKLDAIVKVLRTPNLGDTGAIVQIGNIVGFDFGTQKVRMNRNSEL